MEQPAGLAPAHRTRVLVVDDDEYVLRVVTRALVGQGMEVLTACCGVDGVALARQQSFDVIVSDVSMPELDGLALLRAIRERDLDIPVIFLTADEDVQTAARAIEYGAFRYLTKPFVPTALIEAVERGSKVHELARIKRAILQAHADDLRPEGELASLNALFDRALASVTMVHQPILDVRARRVIAYEALVRSRERGLPSAAGLLEAAERTGRLPELSRAIRRLVAASIGSCPSDSVFVNLHPRDLTDDALYAQDDPLRPHARRIVLEITERASLDHVSDLEAKLARLREIGFRLALDDLGAGYAGLSSFLRIEPDVLKLDMSLVRGIDHDASKRRLVAAMTNVCHEMGRKVVAEGVETQAECLAALECGCDLLQGFLFARPDAGFPVASWSAVPVELP